MIADARSVAREWLSSPAPDYKTAWSCALDSLAALITSQRAAAVEEALAWLRGGPPSSWCTYEIRAGLADEIAEHLKLAPADLVRRRGPSPELLDECRRCTEVESLPNGPQLKGLLARLLASLEPPKESSNERLRRALFNLLACEHTVTPRFREEALAEARAVLAENY